MPWVFNHSGLLGREQPFQAVAFSTLDSTVLDLSKFQTVLSFFS